MSEKINQLMPVEDVRNSHGEWIHPEVDAYWESNFGAILNQSLVMTGMN